MRPSSVFLLTFPKCDLKNFIVCVLEGYSDSFIVSLEKHLDGTDHVHAAVKTRDTYWLEDFRFIICSHLSEFGVDGFDLQPAKSWRNICKYVTKEDRFAVVKNVGLHECHINFQCARWVERTPEFKNCDPFVVGHFQMWNFLKAYHSEYLSEKVSERKNNIFLASAFIEFTWPFNVLQWWNNWQETGWRHKKRQLFLTGPPDTGKSTFVEKLLTGCKIFRPIPGSFPFSGLDQSFDVILFEEFEYASFPRNQLLRLMEGSAIGWNVKYGQNINNFTWRKPIIFINNAGCEGSENAFVVRVQVEEAQEAYWNLSSNGSPPSYEEEFETVSSGEKVQEDQQ